MVSYYTAKVARGQIVIRDIDLPDGTEVSVRIEPGRERRFSPEIEEDIRVSMAQHRRGESISGEESIAELRNFMALHDSGQSPSTEFRLPGTRKMARKARDSAKPARRRAR